MQVLHITLNHQHIVIVIIIIIIIVIIISGTSPIGHLLLNSIAGVG